MTKKSKVILVTGAAGGIGGACVDLLLHQGKRVCAADLKPFHDDDVHEDAHDTLLMQRLDVSDPASCKAVVAATLERFGRLDGLIHMAGIHSDHNWRELEAEEFNKLLSINVTGTFLMAKAAAEAMSKTGGGSIVLTSSGSVNMSGHGGEVSSCPAFVTSKAAVIGLVGALARSFAPLHIRVNAVSPGATDTALMAHYSEEALHRLSQRTLAGRVGSASEIARVASFLVSDAASYVDGQVIAVNGGETFDR